MDIILQVLRGAVAAIFLVVGIYLYIAARRGRQCAYHSPDPYGQCLSAHRLYAKQAFYFALTAVVITEIFVRLNGGSSDSTLLFVHLCLAVPLLGTLAYTSFRHTGIRRPKTHKYFAYTCLALYLGTLLTGLALLFPAAADTVIFTFELLAYVAGIIAQIFWQAIFGP